MPSNDSLAEIDLGSEIEPADSEVEASEFRESELLLDSGPPGMLQDATEPLVRTTPAVTAIAIADNLNLGIHNPSKRLD